MRDFGRAALTVPAVFRRYRRCVDQSDKSERLLFNVRFEGAVPTWTSDLSSILSAS
jgi:hypothetical protein